MDAEYLVELGGMDICAESPRGAAQQMADILGHKYAQHAVYRVTAPDGTITEIDLAPEGIY